MTPRNRAFAIVVVGLIVNVISKLPSIRNTMVNAWLTGVSVVIMCVGLFGFWKARDAQ